MIEPFLHGPIFVFLMMWGEKKRAFKTKSGREAGTALGKGRRDERGRGANVLKKPAGGGPFGHE